MQPLAKRISLLVSIFSLVIGLFLLGYNLRFISDTAKSIALNLWPVLLVLAGIMMVMDSVKKRRFTSVSNTTTRKFPIRVERASRELSCRVQFSYGTLTISPSDGDPLLVTEHAGPAIPPQISQETFGGLEEISIAMSQPLFPSHFQLQNAWRLELLRSLPISLSLQLHAADLSMDLRQLNVESLELSTDSGTQRIHFGAPRKKLAGQIYCASGDLSLILSPGVFTWVRLLNPFCRVEYPQGDFEKREDGSLVTPTMADSQSSVELTIDGPIRRLALDIEEGPET
ncbi:MAG TPA: hypothetical protein VL354_07730 [Spirochaetia bacterium]|nr:hypothetical protein [Spirochaetia bacterium]